MVEHFATDRTCEAIYSAHDSMKVRMRGNKLEDFMNTWREVLGAIPVQPSDEFIEHYFSEQITNLDCLHLQISPYILKRDVKRRTGVPLEIATYKYLVDICDDYLRDTGAKFMRKAMSDSLVGGGASATIAPAPPAAPLTSGRVCKFSAQRDL